jgi:hypothetical protein
MTNAKKNKEVSGTKPEGTAAKAAALAAQDARRRPFRTIRVEDCSASIWARDFVVQGHDRRFYSVTFERAYKDRDGAWKYTKSFDPESLGKLVSLCQQASELIAGLETEAELSNQTAQPDAA